MAALAAAGLALVAGLETAGVASAGPALRITSFRVTGPGGTAVAPKALRRGVAYRYRIDYRIGGRAVVRVRRAGAFVSPYGDTLLSIRPRRQTADPGRYFASHPVRVARADSPGEYRLTYAITATGRSGSTTRRTVLRLRFR